MHIKQKKIIICTSGSKKNNSLGGTMVITDSSENILITGFDPDTLHPWFQYSYKTEPKLFFRNSLFSLVC